MSESTFRLQLLGAASLTPSDPAAKSLPPGKPLALLAYLCCAPARSASREQLIDLLWSDADRDSARHTLRQTLWYIRRRLGASPFETAGDTVQLALPLSCDRSEFLEALAAGQWEAAFELYAGEFFPGFAAPGGAQFEQWADLERRRLASHFEGAAESFLRQALIDRPPREVVPQARRARELAPESQSVWCLLLETLLAAEDRVGAAVEAELLEQWLEREELAIEPTTRALLKIVRNGATAGREQTESGLVAELVGRERVLSRLLRRWEKAKEGSAGHVHLTARAGLGKTRLLEDFTRRLKAGRARVVSVRALQANRDLPFALAADLTLALARLRGAAGISPDAASALVALAPGVSTYLSAPPDRSSGTDALRRRTLAIQELVATVAEDAPIALLVDDTHWGDPASRAVLASLAGGLRDGGVLLVSAGRQTIAGAGEGTEHLTLDRLTVAEVSALVESLGRLPVAPDGGGVRESWSTDFASRLHAAADGSPLLVLETLALALERDVLTREGGQWECLDPRALSGTLAGGSAIRQRLEDVPAAQQPVLILLAVYGAALEDRDVRSVLGDDGVAALPPLEVRGLVARPEGGWTVAHDEIGARIRELATPEELERAHRQSAELLEADDSDSPGTMLLAARHRRDAGDRSALHRLFARLVRRNGAEGDRRTIRALALEVLGAESSAAEREALVASLPWRSRTSMPQLMGASVAAVASVLLLVAAFLPAGVVRESPGDVQLLVAALVGTDTVFYGAELTSGELGGVRELELHKVPMNTRAMRELLKFTTVHTRFGDTAVGSTLAYGSEYGIELMQVDLAAGSAKRLTHAPTDDTGYALSPDGRRAAFISARADTVNEYGNLYIMERSDGSVRRVTRSAHWDGSPAWSPDGTRIAFYRRYRTRQPNEVCLVLLATEEERCLPAPPRYDLLAGVVWESAGTLLVLAEPVASTDVWLLRLDAATGAAEAVRPISEQTLIEPGGEFGLLFRPDAGAARQEAVLFEMLNPELDIVLRFPAAAQPLARTATWHRRRPAAEYRGRLELLAPPDTVRADVLTRLRVLASGRDRRRSLPPRLHFTSLDTTVADVSPDSGLVSPHREGEVRVMVSGAGFRPDTITLRIGPPQYGADVLVEEWNALDGDRWHTVGSPPVRIVEAGDGDRALLLDGDGYLMSGVYQRHAVAAGAGLGFEARVRVPVTAAHWQRLILEMSGLAGDEELDAWVAREDSPEDQPKEWADDASSRSCLLSLPRNEGGALIDQVDFRLGAKSAGLKRLPAPVTDGAWHTVRLQLFRDGRCGLAVDGRVIAISEHTVPLDKPMRLVIQGQSVGTRVLVNRVTMWQGERLDLPWFATPADSTGRP